MACEAEEQRYWDAKHRHDSAVAACMYLTGQDKIRCITEANGAPLQEMLKAQREWNACKDGEEKAAQARILQLSGYITFLLVVEPGVGYGGGETNLIDADVIFKVDSRPEKAFGFQLRDDGYQYARQSMFSLVEEAYLNGLRIQVDYSEVVTSPNQNSFVVRLALVKPTEGQLTDLPTIKFE